MSFRVSDGGIQGFNFNSTSSFQFSLPSVSIPQMIASQFQADGGNVRGCPLPRNSPSFTTVRDLRAFQEVLIAGMLVVNSGLGLEPVLTLAKWESSHNRTSETSPVLECLSRTRLNRIDSVVFAGVERGPISF